VRNRGREDHQIRLEPKPLQPIRPPIQTQTNIRPTPNKSNHSTITQKHPNLAESGGKTRGVKKVRKGDENCVEKIKKQPNFYARKGEVRSVFSTNKPMILLVYKEAYFNTNDLDHIVPSVVISLLQEFLIPNRPAYKSNPKETKELQRQVDELMEKGYIRESMSPCAVPVLLVPKKDGT